MATDHHSLYVEPSSDLGSERLARRVVRGMAPHDWLVLVYLVGLNLAALQAQDSPLRTTCRLQALALLVFFALCQILVRGALLKDGFFAPLLYRTAIYGTVQLSYFLFAHFLPVVNPTTLDRELFELDQLLFGMEPAMVMDAVVTPVTTEWFAFFYFGYFFLLTIHVIPILFAARHERVLNEFVAAMLILFCVGHTLYMLVPGYGPYKAMADAFQNPLPSGTWLDLVMETVREGGAQKDIFPSLHTGAPTLLALFSFRHRDKIPFRYSWVFISLFAVNIVIATMFLRWHYIIDIVAGLALATFAVVAAGNLSARELLRRHTASLGPVVPLFALFGSGPAQRHEART